MLLSFDTEGEPAMVTYGWSMRSPGNIRLSAVGRYLPEEGITRQAARPSWVMARAFGSAEGGTTSVTIEVSIDGGAPVRGNSFVLTRTSPEGARVFYSVSTAVRGDSLFAARVADFTLRDQTGAVIEHWSFSADNEARKALNEAAFAKMRELAATPSACPAPTPILQEPADIARPDWVRMPSPDFAAGIYPPAARAANLPGTAILGCNVTDAGKLADCRVTSETPPGQGFGEAALKLAPLYRMKPTLADGSPVAGVSVQIPINFNTPAN